MLSLLLFLTIPLSPPPPPRPPPAARATTLAADTVWEGDLELDDDLVIPAGRTLVVRAGTAVRVGPARRFATVPGTTSPLVELLVRGRLVVEGRDGESVRFEAAEPGRVSWAGVVVQGGEVALAGCEVRDAEVAVSVEAGRVTTRDCALHHGRYGVVARDGATVLLAGGTLDHLEHGVAATARASVTLAGVDLADIRGRDRLRLGGARQPLGPRAASLEPAPARVARTLAGGVLRGETVLAGHVLLAGSVEVPVGASLVLRPGTLVEARPAAALRVAGTLVATGTAEAPIVLRSDGARHPGAWVGLVVAGPRATARLDHVIVRDAVTAIETVGGDLTVARSTFSGNLRGLDLSGTRAVLRDLHLDDNGDGLQAQGGATSIDGGSISLNGRGLSLSGGRVDARDLVVAYNLREGVRSRAAELWLAGCTLHGNHVGLLADDQTSGELTGLVVSGNTEVGLSLEGTRAVTLRGSALLDNGLAGARLVSTAARLTGNLVAGNAHGLVLDGFTGVDEGTSFVANTSCAYMFEGGPGLSSRGGFIAADERLVCACACDGAPTVEPDGPRTEAPAFVWPTTRVVGEVHWRGVVTFDGRLTVGPDAALRLVAGTRVLGGDGALLAVDGGSLQAAGEPGRPVVLTSRSGRPGGWRGLDLSRGVDTWLRDAVVEHAAVAPVGMAP